MKTLLGASAAVLSIGMLVALPVAAQANSQTNPPAKPQIQAAAPSLPQGSYTLSCKDARMLEGALVAFCNQGNGNWHTTTLAQAGQCAGDIQNMNGTLTCAAGPQTGSSKAPENYNSALGTSRGQPSPTRAPNMNPASMAPQPAGTYGEGSPPAATGTSAAPKY